MSETTRDDYHNRPAYLRQIADELDSDAVSTPCSEASVCREAADEIEVLRGAVDFIRNRHNYGPRRREAIRLALLKRHSRMKEVTHAN